LLLILNENAVDWKWLWDNTSMIRELHVYWNVETLKHKNIEIKNQKTQHKWFGKQLMEVAENISKIFWYKRLSVISWIWVREYYKKLWYKLDGTYMIKKL
jgi:elongator complex protein 3